MYKPEFYPVRGRGEASTQKVAIETVFVLEWAYVCPFSPTHLCGPDNLLSNIMFWLPHTKCNDRGEFLRKNVKKLEHQFFEGFRNSSDTK